LIVRVVAADFFVVGAGDGFGDAGATTRGAALVLLRTEGVSGATVTVGTARDELRGAGSCDAAAGAGDSATTPAGAVLGETRPAAGPEVLV
jgi:hypothetical protein